MKKKTDRQKLKFRLDSLCREIVILRDKGICQKCGKYIEKQNAHCSHVIPRSSGDNLRWDLKNLKLLCFHCHINWWHKNPMEAAKWFGQTFPARWYYLEQKKNFVKKWSIIELQELEKELKQYLRILQNE